jgi:hypothetical protein
MERSVLRVAALLGLVVAGFPALAAGVEEAPPSEESFYAKSLHYTNRGIESLYSKERGGLERITGLSATELGCLKSKCHVRNCDTCHRKDVDGKAVFTVEKEVLEAACQKCHPVEKDDPDVHFRRGMKCMDCHSAREIHGDGVAYDSYLQPGALDTKCEKCHGSLSGTASHTVHGGKLACGACHVRDAPTCYNCHIDSRLKGGKDSSIEVKNLLFLVNHDGKVTPANFLSYVYGNKTMITLAPSFPHSVKKEGRKCAECHDTPIVRDIKAGTFVPFRWEDGRIKSIEGVIPVLEGMRWDLVFLGREGDKWVPLRDPATPLLNYSGYCSPLTREQFARLEKERVGA